MKYRSEEIKSLETQKKSVQNIQILKPPTNEPYPIKPNKRLNVLLAAIVGLSLMVFLSPFFECTSRHKGLEASVYMPLGK